MLIYFLDNNLCIFKRYINLKVNLAATFLKRIKNTFFFI
jgi:hypothetical protein